MLQNKDLIGTIPTLEQLQSHSFADNGSFSENENIKAPTRLDFKSFAKISPNSSLSKITVNQNGNINEKSCILKLISCTTRAKKPAFV
jgi:hypothetical protein